MATSALVALTLTLILFLLEPRGCASWQVVARRPLLAAAIVSNFPLAQHAEIANAASSSSSSSPPDLDYVTTATGLQYADVKPGSKPSSSSSSSTSYPPKVGQVVSIDYVMSTTGARYGSKIYSTVDAGAPYRWTLGDGSTIPGLEEAVMGMYPGGVRRVIIPSRLAYQSKSSSSISELFARVWVVFPFPCSVALARLTRYILIRMCLSLFLFRRRVRGRQGNGTDTPSLAGDGGIPTIQEYLLQPGPSLSAGFGNGREAVREEVGREVGVCANPAPFLLLGEQVLCVCGLESPPAPPSLCVSCLRRTNLRSKYHRRCPGSV